jgi:hypothetical protein
MTNIGKWLTILVVASIVVALVTHPAGAAGDMAVGGSVLNTTLSVVSGKGTTAGSTGQVSYNGATAKFG